MKKNGLLIAAAILFMSLMACNKYKDGPALSLRSKSERVANSWKVAQALDGGNDVTSDYNKYEMTLSKSGSANLALEYTLFGNNYKVSTDGSWVFVSNKEKLSMDYDNDEADAVYTILRLKEKEMWLKKDGSTLEFHFVPR